jgi:hypothetical protein
MASGAKCNFNDQCKSYNCHNKQCKCNEDEQVFIEKQNKCVSGKYSISKQFIGKYWNFFLIKASSWNNTCSYDEQCSYMKPKDATKCIDSLCACNKGYTPVVIPMRGKKCSKICKTWNKDYFT